MDLDLDKIDINKLKDQIFSHRKYSGSQEEIEMQKQGDLEDARKIAQSIGIFFGKQFNYYDYVDFFNKVNGKILLFFSLSIKTFTYFDNVLNKKEEYLRDLLWIFIIDGLISSYGKSVKSDSNKFSDFLKKHTSLTEKKLMLLNYTFRQKINGKWEYRHICYQKCKKSRPQDLSKLFCIEHSQCPINNSPDKIGGEFKQLAKQIYAIRSSIVHHGIFSSITGTHDKFMISDAFLGGQFQSDLRMTSISIILEKKRFARIMKDAIFKYLTNKYNINKIEA